MKGKRYRRMKSTMQYYQMNFGFHPPFNILLDGTFCRAAIDAHIDVKDQLNSYFMDQANIWTTQCIILEVESLLKIVSNLYGAYQIIKKFPIHKCGHKNDRQSASKCIKSLLEKDNPSRYIVATVDKSLREYTIKKKIPAPIVFLHNKTPTIDKPSVKLVSTVDKKLEERLKKDLEGARKLNELSVDPVAKREKIANESEDENVEENGDDSCKLKRKCPDDSEEQNPSKKIKDEKQSLSLKKKTKNIPNPLSCRKSKKKKVKKPDQSDDKMSKRKRRKNKQEDIGQSIKNVFNIS